MCGRMTAAYTWSELRALSEPFWEVPGWEAPERYNIGPGVEVPVILSRAGAGSGAAAVERVVWGAPSPAGGSGLLINARSETAAAKPTFAAATRARRCLVPASGYYEWERVGTGERRAWYFTARDRRPFCFAGLWGPGGGRDWFVVMTAPATAEAARRVHDRVPCVVPAEHWAAWVSPGLTDAERAIGLAAGFGSAGAVAFDAWTVGRRVNSVREQGAGLIEPVEPEPGLFG